MSSPGQEIVSHEPVHSERRKGQLNDEQKADWDEPKPSEEMPTEWEDNHSDSLLFETGNPETGATTSGELKICKLTGNSATVVVESVPGLMTSADFCMFVRPFADKIIHMRSLRVKTERNRYIVVMQFKEDVDASNFAKDFVGRAYLQGLVQETCEIREVCSITFDKLREGEQAGFPQSRMFPSEHDDDASKLACPVCLEPLKVGEASLVTTFCNHTLHTSCLSQCDQNRCPVCRFAHELTPEASACMMCGQREDLWMCVICAFVGCGVYKNKHANGHFHETQHPFAMNLDDCIFWSGERLSKGTVWDYSSERFVNRLLTGDDGKIVEVALDAHQPPGAAASSTSTRATCCNTANLAIVEDEENDRGLQAAVYASRMDAVVADYRGRMEILQAEHASGREHLQEEICRLQELVSRGSKQRKTLQKRTTESEKETASLKERNEFLKNLSENLLRDSKGWNDEVAKFKKELAESEEGKRGLEEQLRDLMMHLEAQAKIGCSSDSCRTDASELRGGDVVQVGPSLRERLHRKASRR